MSLFRTRGFLMTLAFAGAGCGGEAATPAGTAAAPTAPAAGDTAAAPTPAPAAAPAYPATAGGLEKLFTDIRAAHAGGDFATAAKLTKGLIPDQASTLKAIRDDAGATAKKIADGYASEPFPPDEKAARLLVGKPEQTVVKAHGATTEEIAEYAKGSVAFNEFPGGTRDAAQKVLRPGVTFYEVELLEPGNDLGMTYHLFFHDGADWKMLGKVWRFLEK